jgi:glutamine amidotransferase
MAASLNSSVLDFGAGNIRSVVRAVEKAGGKAVVIRSADEIKKAEKLILPGVGHFGQAMKRLNGSDLIMALNEAASERKIPILGICLGMQLMCAHSEEGNSPGLGWFDARVTRIAVNDRLRFKVPHTGWSELKFDSGQFLMNGLVSGCECYFVHAYWVSDAPEEQILCRTDYERFFVSALHKENLFGVQFHPEKSHSAGAQIIRNFITL